MGLDIHFFKTKRLDFKNGEEDIWDEDGKNKFGDKEIYCLRKCHSMRDYLESLHTECINEKIIELNYNDVLNLCSYLPEYYNEKDIERFKDIFTQAFNKNYIVYVECNW